MKHRINLKTDLPMLPLLLVGSLLVAIVSWVSSLPMQADYPNLVIESAFHEDPQSIETIDSIQSKEFAPFTGPLFRGNNQKPVWLRLTLAPSSSADWVALFQPNFIHQVDTWVPLPEGGWVHAVVGIRSAFVEREVQTLVPAVTVIPDSNKAVVMYVRITSPTTPIYAQVISMEDARRFDALLHMVGGVSLGIGILAGLVSFMVFVATRDSLWLMDSVYNLTGLWVLSLQLGVFSSMFAPNSHNLVNQLSLIGHVVYLMLTALIYHRIFGLFTLPRWITWPNLIACGVSFYSLWLIAIHQGDRAMALNNLLIFILTVVGCVVSILVRHQDKSLLLAFRFFYAISVCYFLWWSYSVVFQQQTENFAALYPGLPAALFSILMLILLLVRNTQLKIQQALQVELQRQQVERDLQQARIRHEETNSFYGMLLHEVKNPLSTIRMAVSNLEYSLLNQDEAVQKRLKRVQDSVDHVDDVLKRGVAVDILDQGALMLDLRSVNVRSVVEKACAIQPEAERFHMHAEKAFQVFADEHLLYLMLGNLLDNAAKYSAQGTVVEVRIDENTQQLSAGQVHIKVINEPGSAGFPNEDKIFSKYYRSASAMRMASSGMGLGLYWVRGVARKMGGDALYEQDQGKVVFTLCLPI